MYLQLGVELIRSGVSGKSYAMMCGDTQVAWECAWRAAQPCREVCLEGGKRRHCLTLVFQVKTELMVIPADQGSDLFFCDFTGVFSSGQFS